MCESFINLHFTLRSLYYNLLFPESNVKQLGPGFAQGGMFAFGFDSHFTILSLVFKFLLVNVTNQIN